MQVPRMTMPLFEYHEDGGKYEAVLYQKDHDSSPRIRVMREGRDSKVLPCWMDFDLEGLLAIEVKGEKVQQIYGDGPEIAVMNQAVARVVAELALGCLPPTAGRFKVVWVPDDGFPF